MNENKNWTKEEEDWLKENYSIFNRKFCADKLNKKESQIKDKVRSLSIYRETRWYKRQENPDIKILIPWGDFDKRKSNENIPFVCSGCNKESIKNKKKIQIALRQGCKKIFCSKKCSASQPKIIPLTYFISKEKVLDAINLDFTIKEMAVHLKIGVKGVRSLLRKYNLKTNHSKFGRKNHKKTLDKIKKSSIIQLKNNKNHFFNQKNDLCGLSVPCEYLKNELRKRNIEFNQEEPLLLHLGYLYRADIVFHNYKTVLEVNGKHHYRENGTLTEYFQKRHDLFVNEGWRVFEIPSIKVMSLNFVNEILPLILDTSKNINSEYELFYPKPIKHCKCGKRIHYTSKTCRKCHKK